MRATLARLWLAAAALSAGAFLGVSSRPGWVAPALALPAGAALGRRRSRLAVVGLCVVAFVLGWVGASQRARGSPVESMAARVPRCTLSGTVTESAGGLGTVAAVERARCSGFDEVSEAGVVMFDDEVGDAGSRFVAEGWLIPLGEDRFDVARRRLGAHASLDAIEVELAPPPPGLMRVASLVRRGLVHATASLDPRRAALLRGLAIGDTRALEPATTESFRRAGLSHLVAVSGSNVAIVLGAVGFALRGLSLNVRVLAALGALLVFVLVVGPEPSVLRAAYMGGVGLLALAWGRRAEPLHALALALIAVIGTRPHMIFSVGLHLSAMATAGLVLWSRSVARWLSFLPRALGLGLGATLAAQAAVAPVLVATFGELSLAGPMANLFAMAAVPPATVLGLTAAVAGSVSVALGRFVAGVAGPFVAWILGVGELFGGPAWATVELPRWWGLVLAVPVLICALVALRNDRQRLPRVASDAV